MRCNNCGWDNVNGVHACIKCGILLEEAVKRPKQESTQSNQFGKTISDNDFVPAAVQNEKVFEETVRESMGTSKIDIAKDILISCPNTNCGYLNPGDALICARCKTDLSVVNNSQTLAEQNSNKIETPETINVPLRNNDSFKGTIDPYRKSNKPPECHLTPVLREDEKEGDSLKNQEDHARKFEADENSIQLNRQNLDEDNNTITSKVQAELRFADGKWLLMDKSVLETTFIQVKNEMEIKDGDVILMGNRKFIFSTTK